MTKKEIKKRIAELTGKLALAQNSLFFDLNEIASLCKIQGEINGLEWALKYWDKKPIKTFLNYEQNHQHHNERAPD